MKLSAPFQLIPQYRDYLWGGQRLRPGRLTAEAWVVYERGLDRRRAARRAHPGRGRGPGPDRLARRAYRGAHRHALPAADQDSGLRAVALVAGSS